MVNIERLIDEKYSYFFIKENFHLAKSTNTSFYIDSLNPQPDKFEFLSSYLEKCLIQKIKIQVNYQNRILDEKELEQVFTLPLLSYIEQKYLFLLMVEKFSKEDYWKMMDMTQKWPTLNLNEKCKVLNIRYDSERRQAETLIIHLHRLKFNSANQGR